MLTAATLVLLAAATVLSRVPLLAGRLAHWDAVNYALGLHDFNIAAHQPHPPGSPYLILLARAALALVGGDDNSALILVSVIASVGAVLAEYGLARLLFGRSGGLLAALVLMTQPIFWGYGTTATAWTLLACLAGVISALCLLLARGQARLVLPSALIMGFASGFRFDVTAFLAPLWFWAVTRAEPDWRRRLAAVGLLVGSVLVWLVPVAAGAGGLNQWLSRLLSLLPSGDSTLGALERQLAVNTVISFGTLTITLGPLLVLAFVLDRRYALCRARQLLTSHIGIFWLLWIVPAFTFLWLIDSTEPGHDLVFIGGLIAIGVGLIASSVRNQTVTGAVIIAAQAGVFLLAAPVYNKPLAWTADSMLLNVTAPGIKQQQLSLDSTVQTIRSHYDPHDTMVVTLTGQDPYRFMMYYLPEYSVLRLDSVGGRFLAARGRRQGNWTETSDCLFVDAGLHHAVWVLSAWGEPGKAPDAATLVSSPDGGLLQVWDDPTAAAPISGCVRG